jgi:hypothetical protein
MNRKNTIGQIYAYVVCLGLSVGLVIMTFVGLMGVLKIILPDYTMKQYDYTNYQRLVRQEAFVASEPGSTSDISEGSETAQDSAASDILVKGTISRDPATSQARATAAEMLDAQQRQGVRALLNMVVALVICLPLFWVHFRWAKKLARQETDARVMRRRYPGHRQPRRYNPKSNSKSGPKSG